MYFIAPDETEYRACLRKQEWFFDGQGGIPFNYRTKKFLRFKPATAISPPKVSFQDGTTRKIHVEVASLWGCPVAACMVEGGNKFTGQVVDILAVDHLKEGQSDWNWHPDCLQFINAAENNKKR